ncbi:MULTISPECIES: exodeoxyribonuclease VII small subunit [Geobacillus]|uniref:exodeoxyribonuclease VII small subunit n=1 Tax=Geobacillus TaxID=129337 RepID=UPI0009BFF548|nr:exodeoxyribonuclease VII small subunit [Geobacillus sp. 46C-IIa]OQP05744.1 exodeoxyribonuclease VII small subunit [Geobacillus sp. 46C-IIa]QNU28899.1 exodeoxyribonuclease VII small subunit [Geobacillus sp. 46C-IIa]
MSEEKEMTFEEAMKQLEAIVEKLEEGNVPLEDAIAFFQEGMRLSKLCHDKLQQVEKQLEYMLREDGELVPFSPEEA